MKSYKYCVCDSRYEGCEHPNPCKASVKNGRYGPWCDDCNPRRMDHIKDSLADIISRYNRSDA